jgi:hypothetical protein
MRSLLISVGKVRSPFHSIFIKRSQESEYSTHEREQRPVGKGWSLNEEKVASVFVHVRAASRREGRGFKPIFRRSSTRSKLRCAAGFTLRYPLFRSEFNSEFWLLTNVFFFINLRLI